MTRVDKSDWIEKAAKRKAFRDHARSKFFREVGLQKKSHMDSISGAPQKQSGKIEKLLKLTTKSSLVKGDQQEAISRMFSVLAASGLGEDGEKAGSANTEASLAQMEMTSLYRDWFRAPAFFD